MDIWNLRGGVAGHRATSHSGTLLAEKKRGKPPARLSLTVVLAPLSIYSVAVISDGSSGS